MMHVYLYYFYDVFVICTSIDLYLREKKFKYIFIFWRKISSLVLIKLYKTMLVVEVIFLLVFVFNISFYDDATIS